MISLASSHQSFIANALTHNNHKPSCKVAGNGTAPVISCNFSPEDCNRIEKKMAKLAIVTLAVGVVTLGAVGDASAGKSGGRVGGQAFRSAAPKSSPRINNNSRTNIYINPRVAPPLVGGYGYGYGGSPFSLFAPGPGVAVGIGGGFDTFVFFLFLGAAAAVIRRFFGSRDDED